MLDFHTDTEVWLAGQQYGPGDHSIPKAGAELVKHAGSAHAAGIITVTGGLNVAHVQSQDEAVAAQEAARGEWVEGQFVPAVVKVDDEGRTVLDADGGKVVLEAAYTTPGGWSGPWGNSNRLQQRLEEAQASDDADALAAVEANLLTFEEGAA